MRGKLTFRWRAVHNLPAGLHLYWVLPSSLHQWFRETFRENEGKHRSKLKDAEWNFSSAVRKKKKKVTSASHSQELSLGTSGQGRKVW